MVVAPNHIWVPAGIVWPAATVKVHIKPLVAARPTKVAAPELPSQGSSVKVKFVPAGRFFKVTKAICGKLAEAMPVKAISPGFKAIPPTGNVGVKVIVLVGVLDGVLVTVLVTVLVGVSVTVSVEVPVAVLLGLLVIVFVAVLVGVSVIVLVEV
jgi:hypothetical protein